MSDDKDDKDGFPDPSGPVSASPFPPPSIEPAQLGVIHRAVEPTGGIHDTDDIDRFVEMTSESYSGFQVSDDEVLCTTCKHCWNVRKYAQVLNLNEHGKPFMAREGYCMATPQSLFSLGDRFVLECNLYEPGGKPRTTLEDVRSKK